MLLSRIKPYLRIVIALLMLYLLYQSGLLQLSKIKDAIQNPLILISGVSIFTLQILIFTLRFKLVASILQSISFGLALKLQLIGTFFNTFIPGGVGGDVVKAIELSQATQQQKRNTLALTLVDRVMGLYGLILFSFLFLLIELKELSDIHIKYFKVSAVLFVITSLCLILRKPIAALFDQMTRKLKPGFVLNIKDSILIFFNQLDAILKIQKLFSFLTISAAAQFLTITFLYIVVSQVSEAPAYSLFFPLACFGFVAMAIPVTPGGIGIGQAAFYFIFHSFGDATAEAAIVGISLMQLFNIVFSLPGGYYFIRSTRRAPQVPKSVDL